MTRKAPDPNPLPQELKATLPLTDDDLIMLESLIKSPAFGALRRALAIYKSRAQSELENGKDTHTLFQTQGRLIGLKVIENLPGILVEQWLERNKAKEARALMESERAKRLKSQERRLPSR